MDQAEGKIEYGLNQTIALTFLIRLRHLSVKHPVMAALQNKSSFCQSKIIGLKSTKEVHWCQLKLLISPSPDFIFCHSPFQCKADICRVSSLIRVYPA